MKARGTWRHSVSPAALGLAASVVVLVGALLLLTPSAAGPVESRAPIPSSPGGVTPASILIPSGGPARTTVPCSADSIMLGPDSSVPTPWFNVFNMNFDPNSPVTITFDKPVIGWPGTVEPAGPVTVFDVPAAARAGGKFSFRPADPGVVTVVMRIDGGGCSATTTVYLSSAAGSAAP